MRSMTLQPQARSRLRCCTGVNAASTIATVTDFSAMSFLTASTWPSPKSVLGRLSRKGRMAEWTMASPMPSARLTASARRASAERGAPSGAWPFAAGRRPRS